jgi:hypothetical protein
LRRAGNGNRRAARIRFGAFTHRFQTSAHHDDCFMQAAHLRERVFELSMQTLRVALIGAAPAGERQREDPERADQHRSAECDQHGFQRRIGQNFKHRATPLRWITPVRVKPLAQAHQSGGALQGMKQDVCQGGRLMRRAGQAAGFLWGSYRFEGK